jgi:hypothetical protein
MIDAMWALAYIAENADDMYLTSICQSQSLISSIITFMNSPLIEEQVPALRAAGNILSSSNPDNVDVFIFHGGLNALSKLTDDLLSGTSPTQMLKEVCWCLSNVTAGSQ